MIYVNEIDPYCAAWLQNMMDADVLPRGHIDTRSIEDVTPNDLAGYSQCHFFAGLGGWIHALDLAGWPRGRSVWTGSCPCQPFSAAGKGAGFADERHLWPAWQHLIAQCKPPVVFGEQVASKAADDWIDLVHADLEGMGYAFGCIPFPAASVGAPHIRDRTYWIGVGQADADNARLEGRQLHAERADQCAAGSCSVAGRLADADHERRAGFDALLRSEEGGRASPDFLETTRSSALGGYWKHAEWIPCSDNRRRPVEPGTFPLAHGIPGRVGRLRAYGNSVVAQAAQAFVESYLEAERDAIQDPQKRREYQARYLEQPGVRERRKAAAAAWSERNKEEKLKRGAARRLTKRAQCLVAAARVRSRSKGIVFALDGSIDDIQRRINAGFCELTGYPFDLSPGRKHNSPSLDRINPALGYIPTNVRLVCHAMNAAMGDWGEEALLEIISSWQAVRMKQGARDG